MSAPGTLNPHPFSPMQKHHRRFIVGRLVFGLLSLAIAPLSQADGPYHFLKEIVIGGEGGWDYLSVDPASHRLYVTHATHVVVIDTQANKIVGDIPDTPGVHGVAIAADLGKGFVSNGRENKSSMLD